MDMNNPLLDEIIIKSKDLAPARDATLVSSNSIAFVYMRKVQENLDLNQTSFEAEEATLINNALHQYTVFNSDIRNKAWEVLPTHHAKFILRGLRETVPLNARAIHAICTNDLSRFEFIFNLLNKETIFNSNGTQKSGKFKIIDDGRNLFNQIENENPMSDHTIDKETVEQLQDKVKKPKTYEINHDSIYTNAMDITEQLISKFSNKYTPDLLAQVPKDHKSNPSYNDLQFAMHIVPALISTTQQTPAAFLDMKHQIDIAKCGMQFLRQVQSHKVIEAIYSHQIRFLRETIQLCYIQGGVDILEALAMKAENSSQIVSQPLQQYNPQLQNPDENSNIKPVSVANNNGRSITSSSSTISSSKTGLGSLLGQYLDKKLPNARNG